MKPIAGRDRSLAGHSAPERAPKPRFTPPRIRPVPIVMLAALAGLLAMLGGCSPIKPLPDVEGAEYVKLPASGALLHGQYLRPARGSAPENGDRRGPAIVLIPAFTFLGLREAIELAEWFSRGGYHVLLLSVRGTRGTGGRDDCGLEQTADTVAALDWMAGRKGVHPRRLALVGLGRGGQLALLAAAASKTPRAVAALGAPTDISAWRATTGHPGIAEWIGTVCGDGRQARLRSPALAAGRIGAPVLLIHGEDNRRVPPAQSRLMRDALTREGRRVETLFLPGATHRFSPGQKNRAWRRLDAFLRKTLR